VASVAAPNFCADFTDVNLPHLISCNLINNDKKSNGDITALDDKKLSGDNCAI
jgi:hypothetical protein